MEKKIKSLLRFVIEKLQRHNKNVLKFWFIQKLVSKFIAVLNLN